MRKISQNSKLEIIEIELYRDRNKKQGNGKIMNEKKIQKSQKSRNVKVKERRNEEKNPSK